MGKLRTLFVCVFAVLIFGATSFADIVPGDIAFTPDGMGAFHLDDNGGTGTNLTFDYFGSVDSCKFTVVFSDGVGQDYQVTFADGTFGAFTPILSMTENIDLGAFSDFGSVNVFFPFAVKIQFAEVDGTYTDVTGLTQSFSASLGSRAPVVPEPASLMFLGTGLAALAARIRSRARG